MKKPDEPLDLDAIRERQDQRRYAEGRGSYMFQDIEALIAEVERLREERGKRMNEWDDLS